MPVPALVSPFLWTIHPARARPVAAACALVALSAMGVLVCQLAGDWLLGALASLALFLSLTRFFLPTRYRIDDEAAQVIYPLSTSRLLWSEVGSIRWSASRASIARTSSRREQRCALALDFSPLSSEIAAHLRAFVAARTRAEAWS